MIIKLKPQKGKNILSQLQNMGLAIPAACGGSGRCGKCRIRLVEGHLPVTEADTQILGAKRLEQGWRLACTAYPDEAVTIEVPLPEDAQILTSTASLQLPGKGDEADKNGASGLYAAVDLGTTTIVLVIYDEEGKEVAKTAFLNPQAAFGADVISRIAAANDETGKGQSKPGRMQELVCTNINTELNRCIAELGKDAKDLELIALAGNTTMLHIFRGYSLSGMMGHPFTPVSLGFEDLPAPKCGLNFRNARVHIFPGVSAFVGADIVAGIYGCELHKKSEYQLLMDLGTNGEMALGNSEAIKVSAAAAGPAFEGGNLSCGMGCVKGAVDSVKLDTSGEKIRISCHAIGEGQPEGICGSGAVELLAEGLKTAIIGNDGTLADEYFESGLILAMDADGIPISLTQKDIRELQLAKASVRAVAEMLIKSLNTNIEKIHIKLAGGMGNGLSLEAIKTIGLVPRRSEPEAAGNTCLLGLHKYIRAVAAGLEQTARNELEAILGITTEVPVAGEPEFQQEFLHHLPFEF